MWLKWFMKSPDFVWSRDVQSRLPSAACPTASTHFVASHHQPELYPISLASTAVRCKLRGHCDSFSTVKVHFIRSNRPDAVAMPWGIQRLNVKKSHPNANIVFIKPLPGSTEKVAQEFLERIAAQCGASKAPVHAADVPARFANPP